MSLIKLKNEFLSGNINKQDYIEKMHKNHMNLYEYAEFIGNTDISKIEITDRMVIMTTKEDNIKIVCDKDDFRIMPIEILNFGSYENNEMKMIKKLTKSDTTFFDIGANIGWISINMAKHISNGRIYAFEPIEKTFNYLKKNVEINNLKNVNMYKFGFHNKEEELTFYYYPEGSCNASLANLTNKANIEKINCSVKKLDQFVSENGLSVDFIKCDVEGAELFVFQGGLETIKTFKPIIFTEMLRKWSAKFNYHPNEIIELLRNLEYRCFAVENLLLTEVVKIDETTLETNFFFLHENNHSTIIKQLVK